MNKRQKIVQQAFLDNEEEVINRLEQIYGESLLDIEKKAKKLQDEIEELDKLAKLSISDEEREVLLSRKRSKVYQKQYQEALKKQVSETLDKMHAMEFKTVSDYLDKCYEEGYLGTMYDLQGQGIPLIMPIDQESMVRAIQLDSKLSKDLYSRLGEDVSKLKRLVASDISRGISTGMTFKQIAGQLKAKTNIGYNNAIRIARTEGHRIQCQAGMDACYKAKDMGADVVKQWDSTLDSKTRESHIAVDHEIRELDEKFSNGLMFPSDPSGGAAEVINCRCALLQRARKAFEGPFTKMNNFTKQLESFDGPEDYDEFKKVFFSKENRQYMDYVGKMEDKYETKDFAKVLEKMSDREYNHYSKLLANNPIYNKKVLTNSSNSGKISSVNNSDESIFDGIISKQTGITKPYQATLNDRYAKGTDSSKKAFNKFVPNDSVADAAYVGTPCFKPSDCKVYMDFVNDSVNARGGGTTFFHEHGHYIDFVARPMGANRLSTATSTFGDLLKSDFKAYIQGKGRKNIKDAYLMVSIELRDAKHHSISDLYGALSGGKCQGRYGHRDSYWKQAPDLIEREAFAHMFEASFDAEKQQYMKKYFPNAYAEFEKLIKGVI